MPLIRRSMRIQPVRLQNVLNPPCQRYGPQATFCFQQKCLFTVSQSMTSLASLHEASSARFEVIDPKCLVEEEEIPGYVAEIYYPARIGATFNERYKTLGKIGFGTSSTVWLCRDLKTDDYVVLKIMVHSKKKKQRELAFYEHLRGIDSKHNGRRFVRELLDSFEVSGPHGHHVCLVHQPLGASLARIQEVAPGNIFHPDILKRCLRRILVALDFLRNEVGVVHTDIQPNNLLMGLKDQSVLTQFEQKQIDYPVARKVLGDRTIYLSRSIFSFNGLPFVSDFGEVRSGGRENREDIMPNVYRAPEVILGMEWSYEVDMWSIATMTWDLLENKKMFLGRDPDGLYDNGYHLAEMVAVMGPPPLEFLQRTPNSLRYWDEKGNWRDIVPIPEIKLEDRVQNPDNTNPTSFLQFIREILRWIPEERPRPEEALSHGWLMEGLNLPKELLQPEETTSKESKA